MGRANLMKITVYLTENSPEAIATYRARRDHWVGERPGTGGDIAGGRRAWPRPRSGGRGRRGCSRLIGQALSIKTCFSLLF
jgi:hypothetical protein